MLCFGNDANSSITRNKPPFKSDETTKGGETRAIDAVTQRRCLGSVCASTSRLPSSDIVYKGSRVIRDSMIPVREKVSESGAVCKDGTGGPGRNCALHQPQISSPSPGGLQQMSHFTSLSD